MARTPAGRLAAAGVSLAAAAALLLSAACGESPPPAPTAPAVPTATAAAPTPTPSPTATAAPPATPVAGVSGTSTPDATSTPSSGEPGFAAELDQIDARTSAIRDLPLLRPVERRFLTREEAGEELKQEIEEDREDIYKTQRLYVALGAMPDGQDLFELLVELLGAGVLGFYDSEEERLYVVTGAGELEPYEERTYVHEMVHGIQQQHFDIEAMREAVDDNSDAELALRALIEGDAILATAGYAVEHMTPAERVTEPPASPALVNLFRSTPRVIQTQYVFPYQEGSRFVDVLYGRGGWRAVDAAFARPPSSTEQVMHPEKYESAEAPLDVVLPDLLPALGEGWALLFEDTLGEMILRAYLGTRFLIGDPANAAAGWGGDRVALYAGPDDETVVLLSALWDTERDAREFYDAFVRFTVLRTAGDWEPLDDDTMLMTRPSQAIAAAIAGAETTIIVAPDRPVLEMVRSALRPDPDALGS